MKACPTSGPVIASSSQYAREARSSRASRAISAETLRKREEHLLHAAFRDSGVLAEPGEGPLPHHAAAGEQHEAVAGAAGVGELMDREEQRPPARRLVAENEGRLAGLAQVEPVERL